MKSIFFITILFCCSAFCSGQDQSFTVLESNEAWHNSSNFTDVMESSEGEFIASSFIRTNEEGFASIYKYSNAGEFIEKVEIEKSGASFNAIMEFASFDDYFVALGMVKYGSDDSSYLYSVKMNYDLEILSENEYFLNGLVLSTIMSEVDGNLIWGAGTLRYPNGFSRTPLTFKMDSNGEFLIVNYFESESDYILGIQKSRNDSTFMIQGYNLYEIDENLDSLTAIPNMPNFFNGVTIADARLLNDSITLVTFTQREFHTPNKKILGIAKLDTSYQIVDTILIKRSPDTSVFPMIENSIDFLEDDLVYIGAKYSLSDNNLGQYRTWILISQYDSLLNLNWQRTYGGDENYQIFGMKATMDNGCIVYGRKRPLSDEPFFSNGLRFLMKINSSGQLTHLSEVEINPIAFDIFPNPASDKVYIKDLEERNNLKDPISIKVISLSGKTVIERSPYDDGIDIGYLISGVYIIQVFEGNRVVQSSRFVKN